MNAFSWKEADGGWCSQLQTSPQPLPSLLSSPRRDWTSFQDQDPEKHFNILIHANAGRRVAVQWRSGDFCVQSPNCDCFAEPCKGVMWKTVDCWASFPSHQIWVGAPKASVNISNISFSTKCCLCLTRPHVSYWAVNLCSYASYFVSYVFLRRLSFYNLWVFRIVFKSRGDHLSDPSAI